MRPTDTPVPSYFLWLDTSEHARRRMLDAIDLLRQKETIDELGLGSIRDTIANTLSPGTSTIQTRASYYFTIPWTYVQLEAGNVSPENFATRARKAEIALIDTLANSNDSVGTIGIQARGSLRRLPSMVYWAGLRRLGFRLFPGTQDQYHRNVGRLLKRQQDLVDSDLQINTSVKGNWNPYLPLRPEGFPAVASHTLRPVDAQFFREQIRIHADTSLLNVLVEQQESLEDIDFPWNLPGIPSFPKTLRTWIAHGRQFSELMYGAQLLYNLMLSEARDWEQRIAEYSDLLADWTSETTSRMQDHRAWNRSEFWGAVRKSNPRLPVAAEVFAETWIALVLGGAKLAELSRNDRARALIADREKRLKGNRARLLSRPHLDTWSGASGAGRLDYRWGVTKTIVTDIVSGLQET